MFSVFRRSHQATTTLARALADEGLPPGMDPPPCVSSSSSSKRRFARAPVCRRADRRRQPIS
jgi:hypothetical protein